MLRGLIIRWNNVWVRKRRARVPPANLLLLLSRCLQRSLCRRKVARDPAECERCGGCDVAGLLALRDELKVQCRIADGGREALALTRDQSVRAVVAVACEKELFEGIRGAFPKPVLAILNETPNGPCHDTRVDVEGVRAAAREIIEGAAVDV
ncbi:MAG: DUF116 domain-containing protein [Verrucomicrobiota bacterium]|nr:DUF116 domain-containing protein [Verrucomicrobiota bacterium]